MLEAPLVTLRFGIVVPTVVGMVPTVVPTELFSLFLQLLLHLATLCWLLNPFSIVHGLFAYRRCNFYRITSDMSYIRIKLSQT